MDFSVHSKIFSFCLCSKWLILSPLQLKLDQTCFDLKFQGCSCHYWERKEINGLGFILLWPRENLLYILGLTYFSEEIDLVMVLDKFAESGPESPTGIRVGWDRKGLG